MALLIMKDFNKFVIKFARFLQSLLVIAIGLLGVLLVILLFRDLIPLFQALISPSIKESCGNTPLSHEPSNPWWYKSYQQKSHYNLSRVRSGFFVCFLIFSTNRGMPLSSLLRHNVFLSKILF